jgi:hypothetical protein
MAKRDSRAETDQWCLNHHWPFEANDGHVEGIVYFDAFEMRGTYRK